MSRVEQDILMFDERPTYSEVMEQIEDIYDLSYIFLEKVEILPYQCGGYPVLIKYSNYIEPLWLLEGIEPAHKNIDIPKPLIYIKDLFPFIYYPEQNKEGNWIWKR